MFSIFLTMEPIFINVHLWKLRAETIKNFTVFSERRRSVNGPLDSWLSKVHSS